MVDKVIKLVKLLVENKWILVLIASIFTGTATNMDRLFIHKTVKAETVKQVHKQVDKKADEFKIKYLNHSPQPHTHNTWVKDLKEHERKMHGVD